MGQRFETIEEAGRSAAEFLDQIGQPKLANDVRRVCTSNSQLRRTIKDFYRRVTGKGENTQ